MPEPAGIRYTVVEVTYFERRVLRRYAGGLVALGARRGRGHLGPVLGMEPRTGQRLGQHAPRDDRDHGDVPGAHLLDRGDGARAPAHRRRLLVRAHRDGAVGRLPDRAGGERRVRPHAGRDRLLHQHLHVGDRRDTERVPAALVDRVLRGVRLAEHRRGRALLQGDGRRHRAGAPLPRRLLRERAPEHRLRALGDERRSGRRAPARGPRPAAPARARPASWRACPSRSGSTSRSSSSRWPPRSRWTRAATCRAASWRACSR